MSKTVIGVLTVIIIGLVAVLGSKAEAHWINVFGRCYWHSGECVRKDKDASDPVPSETLGELVATVERLEILCPGPTIPTSLIVDGAWTLTSGKKPIVQADITNVTGDITTRTAEWSSVVSDGYAFFLRELGGTACPDVNGMTVEPLDVIIRSMSPVEMNLYCSPATDKQCNTEAGVPHSEWRAETCELSSKFNFTNYPKNVPNPGVPYQCSNITTCHVVDENGNPC